MDVFSRVDYILVSPALRPDVVKMWVHDSPAVRVASDHRPVLVRLRL
jgi:exonuclease III